jgi:hypothetical protein
MVSLTDLTPEEVVKLTGCKYESHIKDYIVITGEASLDPSNLNDIDK